MLPKCNRGAVEVWHAGHIVGPELFEHGDDVLDRPLDVSPVAGFAVEVPGQEHRHEQRPELVVVVPQERAQPAGQLRRQIFTHNSALSRIVGR